MNRCVIALLTLILCVLPLRAQEAKEATERTEDIEVLRRILNRSLEITAQAPAPTSSSNLAAKPYIDSVQLNLNNLSSEFVMKPAITQFDGIYLKGHGVVYTLKIPASAHNALTITRSFGLSETCVKCHSLEVVQRSTVEASIDEMERTRISNPPIEWVRTQHELRGEKLTATPPKIDSVAVCEPGNLTASLMGKLFHNHQHVRHMPNTESFTVVVTYEGYKGNAKNQHSMTANDLGTTDPSIQQIGGVHLEEAQQIRLGDLHLKNKKYSDAIPAFMRGLKRFTKPKIVVDLGSAGRLMTPEQNAIYEQKTQKILSAAFLSLAYACIKLKLDETWGTYHKNAQDEVNSLLVFATEMSQKLTITVQTSSQATSGIAVPAKLILSFKRSELKPIMFNNDDEVDFRKIMKVETIGFPPADPKPVPAKK